MKAVYLQLEMTDDHLPVRTLSGWMENYSTVKLHVHAQHQVLVIRDGVSLLVDEKRKQPLFGNMTAFIPADLPHRSTVIGDGVKYKCIYFSPALIESPRPEISIFAVSALGSALFDRIEIRRTTDLDRNLNRECLELFFKVLADDMRNPAALVRLPEPREQLSRRIIDFIEANHVRRLTMKDFSEAFPYSGRHLARLFKADLGITIFEYLRLYRVMTAAIGLCDPGLAILDAAYNSGYDSVSSFYRDFNLIFSVTPGIFRDKLRSGEFRL